MKIIRGLFAILGAAAISGVLAAPAQAELCSFPWNSGTRTCGDDPGVTDKFCQGIGIPAGANTHSTFANLRVSGFSASTIPVTAGNVVFPEACRAQDTNTGTSFGPPRTCSSTLVPATFRVAC